MTISAELAHPWDLALSGAIPLQKTLAANVVREPIFEDVHMVGGVDAGYREGMVRGAVDALSYPSLEILDYAVVALPIDYPYAPGLLSFREAPVVLAALRAPVILEPVS